MSRKAGDTWWTCPDCKNDVDTGAGCCDNDQSGNGKRRPEVTSRIYMEPGGGGYMPLLLILWVMILMVFL